MRKLIWFLPEARWRWLCARVFRERRLATAWIFQSSMRPGTWCQTCWWTHLCRHKPSPPCAASPAWWGPSRARAGPGSTPSRRFPGSTPATRWKTLRREARGKPSRFDGSRFFRIFWPLARCYEHSSNTFIVISFPNQVPHQAFRIFNRHTLAGHIRERKRAVRILATRVV